MEKVGRAGKLCGTANDYLVSLLSNLTVSENIFKKLINHNIILKFGQPLVEHNEPRKSYSKLDRVTINKLS